MTNVGKCVCRSVVLLLFCLCLIRMDSICADTWDNAYSFYKVYKDTVIFEPDSEIDGGIYYCTRANASSSSIRFRTIGWKMTFRDENGKKLQSIYFKLNGNYLAQFDTKNVEGYKYNLYSVRLSTLKRRLSDKALAALNKGTATMTLDACMVVVKKNKELGAMNDSGPTSGKVYTTYKGIVNAENWSATAKESLKKYFNKTIDGLFYKITLIKTDGIKNVSGGGTYCYGTLVSIQANTKNSYRFLHWDHGMKVPEQTHSFFVMKNETWTAYAKKGSLTVTYHRREQIGDKEIRTKTYTTQKASTTLLGEVWKKPGYRLIGWSTKHHSNKVDYSLNEKVDREWIFENEPSIHLYGVWERVQVNVPIIRAKDLYFTLKEAREGLITEERIALEASAYDVEDGVIPYGQGEETCFVIKDYQPKDYRNLTGTSNITQTFYAMDSDGNEATAMVWVHIVDTSPRTDLYANGKWRFIRADTYEFLSNKSVWKTKDSYQQLLEQVLKWHKEKVAGI